MCRTETWSNRVIYVFGLAYLSRLCLYVYYLHRIQISFNGSSVEISNKCYIIIKTLILVTELAAFMMFECVVIIGNESNLFRLTFFEITLALIVSIIIDIFWGLFLVVQFIKRLSNIMKITKRSSNLETYKHTDNKFKYIVSKLTILACVSVMSTCIIFTISVLLPQYSSIVLFDGIVNSLCLVLTFNFFDETYKKLCVLCRFCCENCR